MEINVNETIEKYFDNSSLANGETPKLVIIMGGTGAGKTTVRKQSFSSGYVLIDASDVWKVICKGNDSAYKFGEDFAEALEIIGQMIADRAIEEKRNIVIEIIGDDADLVRNIMATMKSSGYECHLEFIACDPIEAYERHLKGALEFLSCYFSQPYHIKWLMNAAKGATNCI